MLKMIYKEHEIKPSGERPGCFVVVKDGCNALPGASFCATADQARRCIDALELSKGDSRLYWLLLGQAGLAITTMAPSDLRRAETISCPEMQAQVTVWRDGAITYGLHLGVNPKEALALAAALVKAANSALALPRTVSLA